MYNQEEYIYEEFIKNFNNSSEPLIIYGIGINTEKLLARIQEYNIVGLMDGKRKDGEIYGKPILDIPEVLSLQVKKILILARPAVLGMLYHRIAGFTKENGILVMDIHGENLAEKYGTKEYDIPYYKKSWSDLRTACEVHDIITFDIFDTLVLRKTMQPKDIFYLVESEQNKQIEKIADFAKVRMQAEKNCYEKGMSPNIYEIYDEIGTITGATEEVCKRYLTLELEMEFKFIVPRESMREFFLQMKESKQIYLISDMYLPKNILVDLLSKCGYEGYQDIYVSCEHNCSKLNGLFARFIAEDGARKDALHIGDNAIADGKCARAAGLDTFEIMNVLEMLENSVYNVLLEKESTLMDRVTIGLFCQSAFDDPFIFYDKKGKLSIDCHKKISFLFVAPMIYYFVCWLMKGVLEEKCDYVLFPSRDAYILQKMCDLIRMSVEMLNFPNGSYTYMSRRAMLAATVYEKEDAQRVASMEYHGTVIDLFKERFNLELPKTTENNLELVDKLVDKYEARILSNCACERNNYLNYLSKKDILTYKKMAFIDFVAAGTVQNGFRKLVPNQDVIGFYFLKRDTNDAKLENEMKVKSFYKPKGDFQITENVYSFYLFLELFLTSPEPTFCYINDEGKVVFMEEVREDEHIRTVIEMQEEVLGYCQEMISLYPHIFESEIRKEVPDQMVGFIGKEYSDIISEKVQSLALRDEYLAKSFNIFDK